MDNEDFYDHEIAPELKALCEKCQERGIGFLAVVAYNDAGDTGRTCVLPEGHPAVLDYSEHAGAVRRRAIGKHRQVPVRADSTCTRARPHFGRPSLTGSAHIMKFYYIVFGIHTALGGPFDTYAACDKELVAAVHNLGIDPGAYGGGARNGGTCFLGYDFRQSSDPVPKSE